jgi:hypothetical protein
LLLVFSSLALFASEVMEGDDDALPLAGVGKHVYRTGWDVGFPAVGEVDDSTDVMVAGEIGPANPVADLDTSQACGHLVFLRTVRKRRGYVLSAPLASHSSKRDERSVLRAG